MRKTNIICTKCGEAIYSNEGFLPGKKPRHMMSCKCKLKPHQIKLEKKPEINENTYSITEKLRVNRYRNE